jgi:CubicO group peptidase (beta-lactamase class C family)
MRLNLLLVSLGSIPRIHAYCPPTGPVLPVPVIEDVASLTSNLTQSLLEVSQVSADHFNLSATSFSVQITGPDAILYEFHHTAPVRNTSGVDKVTGDSVYRVASVTKMVTTLALLLQESANLDDPVTKYVPGLLDAGLHHYGNVTLRMLASQISGTARDSEY